MLRLRDRDPPRTRAERPCQRLSKVRRYPASGDPIQPSPHSVDSDIPDSRRIEMRDSVNGYGENSEQCEMYGCVTTDDNNSQNHCDTCRLSTSPRLNNCQCCGELSGRDGRDNVAFSFPSVLSWRGVCDFGCRSKKRSSAISLMFNFLLLLTATAAVQGRGIEVPRYETAYACEGKTLKIECRDGEVIHLIRANYGRFSITICNDHGNTDWSVNCMSTKSLRVLHNRCSMNQNCSILASTSMFGDPCPNTLKYLEAHYQCVTAATTSSTIRPSPPWLITSQPSVWRSTVPTSSLGSGASNGAGNGGREQNSGGNSETKNNGGGSGIPPSVHHLAPPTFRPHITMPPDLRPGVVKIKNDGHSPEVIGKPVAKVPPESVIPIVTEQISNNDRTEKPLVKTNDEEQSREIVTEDPLKKKDDKSPVGSGEHDRDTAIPPPPHEKDHSITGEGDGNRRHHHHNHHDNPDTVPSQPHWRHCSPQLARGLQWNWTAVGEVALQPCPGGATGLARWRCVSSAHKQSHLQQQRRLGAPSRETGSSSQERAPLLLDGLGSDSLLTGRDIDTSPDLSDFRDDMDTLMLPDSLASSAGIDTDNQLGIDQPNAFGGDGQPVWISENPDLSECRSVWLNSLETRVKEGESLLSISNDLSQVTSSKTLYGGDMMTTTGIMKRLAQRMALNIQSFPDTRQREAIVSDLLLGVVKTGSNLLDISQQASWKDLSHPVQMRVATSLLIGLEENAFLLAEAVLREKTIVHQMKNIVLSVRVLEVRHVETEEFPSALTREQWTASQDTIHLPRGALIDNSEGGLVRIVFVAFDRLEEILQPLAAPPSPTLPEEAPPSVGEPQGNSRHQQMNSQRDRDNITRVINSKVISASLGKGRHIQLSQPVRLTLRHLRTDNVTNPTCVFWDYTVNVWSAEGCRVEWTNSTHTGCQCSHLTNFALLMDVHAVPLSPSHALALHLITVIGCAISAVALFAALIVFHCFKGMKTDRITIHKNLCACLLIAELIFMLGVDRTANRVLCGVIAAFLHYFFLAAFAWMFLEGFQLYAMLVEVFEPERARARWYYPAAYFTPLVIVGVSGIIDPSSYGTPQQCWLRADNYFILSFLVPVAVVLVVNWLCLFMVIYMMCRHSNVSIKAKENNKLHKIKVWLRSSLFLTVLLGLTWTFGLLYLNEQTIFMAYTFSTLNSLQGLFIFVFHCLQNEAFQKECGRLGRQHSWLSCCLRLAPAASAPVAGATGSSSAPQVQQVPTQQTLPSAAKHSGRHHHRQQHQNDDQCLEDVSDMDHNTATGHSSTVSASTTNNLVINNLNVVVNNNNHNNNHVINNAAVASLAAAAAAHGYHQHRNRRNSSQCSGSGASPRQNNRGPQTVGDNHPRESQGAYFNSPGPPNHHRGSSPGVSAPMSHLRNPLNASGPPGNRGYRHNLQQGEFKRVQRYTLKQHHHNQQIHLPQDSPRSWNTSSRPSAPPYVPPSTDQTASHSLSMPSIHNNGYHQPVAQQYHQPNRAGTPVPAEFQSDYNNGIMNNDPNDPRSRSPSCFSVKMSGQSEQGGWGVVQNPLSSAGVTGTWKSTSSKHHGAISSNSLQHPDHARRVDPSCRPTPQQSSRHEAPPRHPSRQHHHHPHPYSEIGRHRRGSEERYRDIHDDPVYEEIERNLDNTLMSDASDDNSGHGMEGCVRQVDPVGSVGHHGSLSSKFYGDHRPLISYSPGERHRYDRSPVALDHHAPHGKYGTGRWDVNAEQGRASYGYRPKERALAAVLNGDNDVASRVLCHGERARNTLQAYSDDI